MMWSPLKELSIGSSIVSPAASIPATLCRAALMAAGLWGVPVKPSWLPKGREQREKDSQLLDVRRAESRLAILKKAVIIF